jgi:branched-chain amino acid transport system permease protein
VKVSKALSTVGRYRLAIPAVLGILILLLPYLHIVSLLLQQEIQLAAIYTLLVIGFSLAYGFGGQLALGQVAVFAGGAYITAIMFNHGITDLLLAAAASIAFAALLGVIAALPGLRFAGWSLALVSFFLVLLIPNITDLFSAQDGGVLGIPGIIGPTLFGQTLGTTAFYVLTIACTALTLFFFRNIVKSRYGSGLLVLKHGSQLARSLGLSPVRTRLATYVLAALPAGLAGVLYAYYSSYIQADVFDFNLVTLMIAAAAIAGTQSLWGAPIAAAILVIGPDQVSAFNKYSLLAYGILLVVFGVLFATGLSGTGKRILRRYAPGLLGTGVETGSDADTAPVTLAGKPLKTCGVTKAFGGVQALAGVDFEAQPGQITAIIGANGAGKTTLLNAISGLIPIESGEVQLGGETISGRSADKIARAGISRTFQTPQIPDSLNVLEVAASSRIAEKWVPWFEIGVRSPRYLKVERTDAQRARAALAFVGLEHDQVTPASLLPLGQRRILEVARAIAAEPAVVLLDEPGAGLDSDSLGLLGQVVRKLRDEGATVVLIEHNVTFVMDVADVVYVMELGSVIAHGAPDEVRSNQNVIASYLGRRHGARGEQAPAVAAVQAAATSVRTVEAADAS